MSDSPSTAWACAASCTASAAASALKLEKLRDPAATVTGAALAALALFLHDGPAAWGGVGFLVGLALLRNPGVGRVAGLFNWTTAILFAGLSCSGN